MAEEYDAAVDILAAVKTAYLPYANKPARYMIQPGTQVGYDMGGGTLEDMCCAGAVIIVIGAKEFANLGDLRTGGWSQPYMIIVLRCAPVGTMQAGPSDAAYGSATQLYTDDMKLVRTAVRNFLASTDVTEADSIDWSESMIDPQGGCSGSQISFTIPVMEDC